MSQLDQPGGSTGPFGMRIPVCGGYLGFLQPGVS